MENGFVSTSLNERIASAPVYSLMVPGQRRWDYDVVADIFNTRDRDLILKIPLSNRRDEDVWFWLVDPHGQYTVRSCYKMLTHCSHAPISSVWRKLWNLTVPNKVKSFLWRTTMNVLPTCDNLIRRRVEVMPICSFCNHQNETVLHALVDCAFARTCWISSSLGFVGYCSSFLSWLEQIFTRSSKEMCNLIAMICWKLWMRRNDKIWNNKTCSMSHVLNSAGHYLFQWQAARK